jgi:oxygen-dependent protoporphyrinogen oxidase
VVALAFPTSQLTRALNGYGYVVPRAEGRDVTAMTWVSSKWAHRVPEGYALVRVFLGRTGREEVLQRDDADLVELAIAELGEMLGLVVSPHLTRVQRWERAMPQYVLGHGERVARIESDLAQANGLALTGTMLRGVGIPDVISSAERAAQKVLADLDQRPTLAN